MSRKPLIAGNWKMNLNHAEAVTLVQKLAWTLDDSNFDFTKTEVAVFFLLPIFAPYRPSLKATN